MLSKPQIKWVITPCFCDFLRKAELYMQIKQEPRIFFKQVPKVATKVVKEVERVAKVPIKPKKVAVAVKSMFVIFCVKSNPKFWKL